MNNDRQTMRKKTGLAHAGVLALAFGALMSAGCQGERSDEPPHQFLPDMDDSPKFRPQSQTEFFKDGRVMRPSVKGVVAFGDSVRLDDPSRTKYLRASLEMYEGIDSTAKPVVPAGAAAGTAPEPVYVKTIPAEAFQEFAAYLGEHGQAVEGQAELTKAMIKRGQERFNIYCSACHGYSGEGGDPANFRGSVVGRRWSTPVPSLQDAKYRDRSVKTGADGYIFHVIRNGVVGPDPTKPPNMPSYADKVNERDAWAIVAYVRTLQAGWQASVETAKPAVAAPAASAPTSPAPAATTPKEAVR